LTFEQVMDELMRMGREGAVRVYEAIVKGLESAGVEAAFGGGGEKPAGFLISHDE
jgi:hypothetical protein